MGKNKRSKSYYIRAAKRQKPDSVLGPEMVGFLCTCNFNERDCVKEAYDILNEFATPLYGKEYPGIEVSVSQSEEDGDVRNKVTDDTKEESQDKPEIIESSVGNEDDEEQDEEEVLDIEAAIKADVLELKKNNQEDTKVTRRFQQVMCAAKNCVFIRTTLEDPLPLSLAIMDDILSSQKQRTKRLLRMVPVQATCKAYPDDIKKLVEEVALTYFKESGKTFCVVFKVRNNTKIKKENLVLDLARVLQKVNSENTPNLHDPDVVVNVNILRNICCLSFLPNYFSKYCKYNLVLLASKNKSLNSGNGVNEEGKTALESSLDKDEEVSESNIDNGEKLTTEINDDRNEEISMELGVDKSNNITTETGDQKGNDASVKPGDQKGNDASVKPGDQKGNDSSVKPGEQKGNDASVKPGDQKGNEASVKSVVDEKGNDASLKPVVE